MPIKSQSIAVVTIDADDVKPAGIVAKSAVHRQEHCRGIRELGLLPGINGQRRINEASRRSVPDFNEGKAVAVQHDQVDFTAPRAKIPGNRPQAARSQVAED